jgi:hypothetical protein
VPSRETCDASRRFVIAHDAIAAGVMSETARWKGGGWTATPL